MTEHGDPLIGRTVAHYEILARLGGGGMGVVYKARDTRLGRIVALKFLPPQWSHDENAKQRFIREAQAASATDHRNICTIHDIGTADDGQLFIVMAYYEGETLKQRLERGPVSMDEALDIATQVAEGLARAHAQGVVHRDVKPGNLILAEDGVRIVDFGLATFADALQLTVTGSTLGTAAYMSPEQVRGEQADARTDVWAVGAILYQMLAGHVPFQGAYAEAIAYAIRHEAPAPLRATRPEIPEEVEQLVFRALHKEAVVRYASGRELARALRQVRGQTVPMDLRTEPVAVVRGLPSPAAGPRRRRRGWLAAIAAGVLVLAGGAAGLLRPGERTAVVVVPVANPSAAPEIEPYRRALTLVIVQELAESSIVRPTSWARTLQTLRSFAGPGGDDISSLRVMRALDGAGGARVLVQPTILYDERDREWRVRVTIVDGETLNPVEGAAYESDPLPDSALPVGTAFRLAQEAATLAERHFQGRWRLSTSRRSPTVRSPDAWKAFEEGLDRYEQQEYSAALASLATAAAADPRSASIAAWLSRVALLMRKDEEALKAANRALPLLSPDGPRTERLFTEAMLADSRGDADAARAGYAALARAHPDDPAWIHELAAFDARRAETREAMEQAVRGYHDVLALDPSLIRPHLELCRLYNRLQNGEKAQEAGERALAMSVRTGWQGAEALARFCLVDTLRAEDDAEKQRAQEHAEIALATLEALSLSYNVPRGLYYLGLTAGEQSRLPEAANLLERAAAAARTSDNLVIEPVILGNLGVVYERLGDGPRARALYERSFAGYERLGDERRAARQRINSAALRIRFGEDGAAALKDAERAVGIVSRRGDREFEAAGLEIIGDYHRLTAQYAEADRELDRALSLASLHNLTQKIGSVKMARVRLWFDMARYGAARDLLTEILAGSPGSSEFEARLTLAHVHIRLGDLATARALLSEVARDLAASGRAISAPLSLTLGELEYEANRLPQARAHFDRAAGLWSEAYTQGAAVEARARLGWVDAVQGRVDAGRFAVAASLDRARAMGWTALEATCRVLLARVHLLRGDTAAARAALDLPPDVEARLGLELRVQIQYWRGVALGTQGAGAVEVARRLLGDLGASVPEPFRAGFAARRDVRLMAG